MDKLAGLGKAKLSSGGLRSALKSLHESIMGKSSLQHAFYEFDKNKDNRISREEFLEACSDMTTKLPESQLAEVVSVFVVERMMLLPCLASPGHKQACSAKWLAQCSVPRPACIFPTPE